jgi:CheY-like chemotaxis protein
MSTASVASKAVASRRVLVIEDQADSRDSLRMLLELWGHRVEVAPDGVRGVEKALAWRPDVIVLDIGMPRLDGYEAARQVRAALGNAVLLVAWTGYDQRTDRQRAYDAGFDFHIAKASDPSALQLLLSR